MLQSIQKIERYAFSSQISLFVLCTFLLAKYNSLRNMPSVLISFKISFGDHRPCWWEVNVLSKSRDLIFMTSSLSSKFELDWFLLPILASEFGDSSCWMGIVAFFQSHANLTSWHHENLSKISWFFWGAYNPNLVKITVVKKTLALFIKVMWSERHDIIISLQVILNLIGDCSRWHFKDLMIIALFSIPKVCDLLVMASSPILMSEFGHHRPSWRKVITFFQSNMNVMTSSISFKLTWW